MRKFLLIICLFIALGFRAQPYFFQQTASTYLELTNPAVVSGPLPWTNFQPFNIPIGFPFNYMGNTYTSVNIEGSGFAFFDPSYYYCISPFTVQLRDVGTSSSLSPLSYQQTGNSPNRVCKIQWKNCGFQNDLSSSANFQLWLYETSNRIEVHIGPCAVVNPINAYQGNGSPGPVVGIFEYSNASNCSYSLSLYDLPAAALDTLRTGNISYFGISLNGTPASGVVYQFNPGQLGVGEYVEDVVSIFPNPATSEIGVRGQVAGIRIYGVDGDLLYNIDAGSVIEFINIEEMPSGILVFCFTLQDGRIIFRRVVKL